MASSLERVALSVVSGGDEVRRRSYVNHYIWARENGLPYRLDIGLARGLRTIYDSKYVIIRRALDSARWVLWVDDDVYFTRWSADGVRDLVAGAEAEDAFFVVAEGPPEPNGVWSRINTGVMLLRHDPRTALLLERAQSLDVAALQDSWDFEQDGLFSAGDQDALWRTITEDEALQRGTRIVGHAELNSRPHLYQGSLDDALAVHFCGDHKEWRIEKFALDFGLGLELVPEGLLDEYTVRVRQSPARSRYLRLRAERERYHLARRVRAKIRFVRTERRWR